MNLTQLTRVACLAAEAGAETARSWQHQSLPAEVRQKTGPRDLVSQADLDTEQTIRKVLTEHRPHDSVLGEEHGHTDGSTGVHWLVDPIDGTTSYLYGRADWSVSVAALDRDGEILCAAVAEPTYRRLSYATKGRGSYVDGRAVMMAERAQLSEALVEVNFGRPDQHPMAGRMVEMLLPSVRDLRRGGSAASALAGVAAGRADAVWSPGLQPWDGAAGILLVREAGGMVGDLQGPGDSRWPPSGDVLAAPTPLWGQLRDLLWEVYLHGRQPGGIHPG